MKCYSIIRKLFPINDLRIVTWIGDSMPIIQARRDTNFNDGWILIWMRSNFRWSLHKRHQSHCSKSSFFVQKFNFDFPRKIVELFWVKTRENAAVLDFLAVDNFDFTRKIDKKIFWMKKSWKCWRTENWEDWSLNAALTC